MKERCIKKWEVLKSKQIFDKPWLNVRDVTFKLPTGVIVDHYYLIDYNDMISVIAITETGEFVMERQYRPGINDISLEICGGATETSDDNFEMAARRELSEETGYEGGQWSKLMEVYPNACSQSNKVHIYLAQGVKKVAKIHQDKTEDIEVFLMKEKDLLKSLQNGEICQAVHAASLWKYFGEKAILDVTQKTSK